MKKNIILFVVSLFCITNVSLFGANYYSNQLYLKNSNGVDINVEPAWEIIEGISDITVAIIDDGGQSHVDIPSSRIVTGYDFIDDDNGPTSWGNEAHGMACAGIIAATKDNNEGIAGIAPNCKLMFLKLSDPNDVVYAIRYARKNGADVINLSISTPAFPAMVDAIDSALTYGRDGKGCTICVAIGNSADRNHESGFHPDPIYGSVEFPATCNGVIAVGAIDNSGTIQDYSPRGTGTQISVVAQSSGGLMEESQYPMAHIRLNGGVWSTDKPGQFGWNPGDYCVAQPDGGFIRYISNTFVGDLGYTAGFGGTSAATPQVSGVAALILSLNPDLTSSQVKSIIEESAVPYDPSGYDTDYGHGRLDAYKAVKTTIESYGATLPKNITVPTGKTLNIESSTVIDLNTFSITSTGGTITVQNGADINPKYISVTEGGAIKGLYSSLSEAYSATTTGQIVELHDTYTFSSNYTVPTGKTFKIGSDAHVTINSPYTIDNGSGTLLIAAGADITPDIRVMSGSTIEGLYQTLSSAFSVGVCIVLCKQSFNQSSLFSLQRV